MHCCRREWAKKQDRFMTEESAKKEEQCLKYARKSLLMVYDSEDPGHLNNN